MTGKELPEPSDLEIVQMMAAQRIIMERKHMKMGDDRTLHDMYLEQVKRYGKEYGVRIPDHYD